jgi:GNAT superfamily N-acetyltransferase
MSARALAIGSPKANQLRPFKMRGDLSAVADLVELCFQDTLDEDGRMYIQQMRRTAQNSSLLNAAISSTLNNDLPPGGYVWEEENRIVGNLSLIPILAFGKRHYLIANVAVDPKYRRRGIASQLTEAALEQTSTSKAEEIWLQVDHNNQAAIELYRGMGFRDRAHRIGWISRPRADLGLTPSEDIQIRHQRTDDWGLQKSWLEANYPGEVRWNLPLDLGQLQPGFLGSVQRLLGDRRVEQWAAESADELMGVLSWQSSMLNADRLWLATGEDKESQVLPSLLSIAHKKLRRGRKFLLNYAAGRSESIFEEFGFSRLRELIWMRFDG